jgi:hypothetical protein
MFIDLKDYGFTAAEHAAMIHLGAHLASMADGGEGIFSVPYP